MADYQQIFQVSRNQAIKDVKEGVFELSRSAVIFYPKEGRFDCVARPWLTEAGSRSARGIWEIEFNHKLLPYIYGLTTRSAIVAVFEIPGRSAFMKVLLNSNLQAYGLLLMLG